MSKRRFIAGAVCPKCAAVDRLVLEALDNQSPQRRCVACGFVDTDRVGSSPEPKTRLEGGLAAPVTTKPDTVKIIGEDSA